LRIPRHSNPQGKNVIGPHLRKLRKAMRPAVTLEDLAGRLAVRGLYIDRTSLGRIERQERSVFDFEITAIAAALKVPLLKLFGVNDA
jgi:transcriptional regulator with XRE-family HTH domain